MNRQRLAAHVHSDWSYDGQWPLREIARLFRRLRYDVVLMAEHDRGFDERRWSDYQQACAEASTDEIFLMPGIEYEDATNVVHIPVWGDGIPFLGAAQPTLDVLRAADHHGAATLLAHPWRRNAVARYTPDWRPHLSAVEIWSRKYDGAAPRREAREFSLREGLAAFVSLDFHSRQQLFPLAMTMAADGLPTAARLVQAMRKGACRPEFLGLPAERFLDGPAGSAVRSLDLARRSLRRPVRRLQRAARARS